MRTPVRTYLLKNHENVWRIHQKALSLHVMRHKIFQTRYFGYALLALACLLTACSGGSSSEEFDSPTPDPTPSPTPENQEIKLNASVWNMMEGMRASTYDDQAAIQTEGHFTCTVYQANTTTPYINTTTVDWNGDPTNKWLFNDGKHYWPATGNLDFFAYMPKADKLSTDASYITGPGPTYELNGTLAPAPYFTCDMRGTVNKEFIWALATGQNKAGQGADGVTLTFKHPFTRIYFKLSESSGTAVRVNSITLSGENFYKTGKCTFDGTNSTWSNEGYPGSLGTLAINTPYLIIPGDYGSQTITVNVSWDEWNSFSTDLTSSALTLDWQAGYSYTYTLTVSKYALKVDTSKYTEQW